MFDSNNQRKNGSLLSQGLSFLVLGKFFVFPQLPTFWPCHDIYCLSQKSSPWESEDAELMLMKSITFRDRQGCRWGQSVEEEKRLPLDTPESLIFIKQNCFKFKIMLFKIIKGFSLPPEPLPRINSQLPYWCIISKNCFFTYNYMQHPFILPPLFNTNGIILFTVSHILFFPTFFI